MDQFAIGWYDRDVTKIFKVAPKEEAERLVGLLGGKAKVVEEARAAMNKEEFAWGAQLIQYVYLLEPIDKEVRQLKADILRQLGRRSLGTIPRNFLLTEARALEGKVTIPIMIPPQPGLVAGSPETFVDYFRVRIDPAEAENTDLVLGFVFTDKEESLRRPPPAPGRGGIHPGFRRLFPEARHGSPHGFDGLGGLVPEHPGPGRGPGVR